MKKIVLIMWVALLIVTSCKFNIETQKTEQNNPENKKERIRLNPLDGYFFTKRISEIKTFVVEESDFHNYFNPAATMTFIPRSVDFTKEKVGAIVLPETEYDTEIILDSADISGRILHVFFSVNYGDEKRTYTIIPVKLFTFDSALDVDSVLFENKKSL